MTAPTSGALDMRCLGAGGKLVQRGKIELACRAMTTRDGCACSDQVVQDQQLNDPE
jgi:hypothetical protein